MVWRTLDEAKAEALACTKCGLARGRTQVVWMDGDAAADLLFIGEAPGFHEDRQGRPFVGAAGRLLDSMLASIGLDRTTCAIANVIKCRPPGNRDPLPDEIETCRPYLDAQLAFMQPTVVVTLGNFATRYVLARQVSISRVRGQRFTVDGRTVIPTFHPAAILHGGGEGSPQMQALRSDFALVRKVLDEKAAERRAAAASPPAPAAPPAEERVEQQSFF
ncbi:MAG: uracil-DNA glycosylase [Actinomycetota bacterium]